MKLESIELINYKSIGTENSKLIIEPGITIIIGMNESGKSNILEALSKISFSEVNNEYFTENNYNRNSSLERMKIIAIFKKDPEDKYNRDESTRIEISKNSYIVSGGLKRYYNSNILGYIQEIDEIIKTNPYQIGSKETKTYNQYKAYLVDNNIDIPHILKSLNYFKKLNDTKNISNKSRVNELISLIATEFNNIKEEFPVFYYRNSDKVLRNTYSVANLNETTSSNDLIEDFLKLIGKTKSDLINFLSSKNTSIKTSLLEEYNDLIDENINTKFYDFYKTEKIVLKVNLVSNSLSFYIKTEESKALLLSERSNGLKWYLNHYIDIRANNLENKKVIYLLDEPGVFLHINAQKELLNLFKDLCNDEKGNQVIYTTHLPSMLDIENTGIHRIRAIKKDKNGNTHILKNAYDQRLTEEKSQNTIAPALHAIGSSATYGIYPVAEKINIVVEGISDYIYITTIFNKLDLNISDFNLIPCTGVKNVVNICSILLGWGCKFIALFDYDSAGVQEATQLKSKLCLELNQNYIFVIDVSKEDMEKQQTFLNSPIVIEDLVGKEFIKQYEQINDEAKLFGKPLKAKTLCKEIEENTIEIPNQTKENFQKLYDRIILAKDLLND